MVQSVELLLDARLDAAVRRQWQVLAEAGVRSQASHRGTSHRPHVTLAVSRLAWADDVEAAIARAVSAEGVLPVPLRLGGLVVFTHRDRHVLARLVVPSTALLGLHARVAEAVAGAPGAVAHLDPGEWTPHVTLARSVPTGQFPAALEALAAHAGRDDGGAGPAVRRWDGDTRREWPVSAPAPEPPP